jgi:CheY-like chemotaxis protein
MNKTKSLHILYLIDDACFSDAIRKSIIQEFSMSEVQVVSSRSEYLAALETENPDLIIFGNHVPGLDSLEALGIARQKCSGVPFLFASGHIRDVSDTKGFKVADATGQRR